MIITNLTGGLGNQMFQYALGRHLAIKNKTTLKLHFTNALFATQRSFSLDCFNIQADVASNKDLIRLGIFQNRIINRLLFLIEQKTGLKINPHIITERKPVFDNKILLLSGNLYLQGYWQSERYFKPISNQLHSDFAFVRPLNRKNKEIVDLIKRSDSISIHIRRGDYVTDSSVKKTFTSMGNSYYKKAMGIMEKRIKNPTYFVFSDDMDWAKENIKSNFKMYYIDHNSGKYSYEDMRLISLCKHNIIANSSFSWWGAWLNDSKSKIIISPSQWSSGLVGKDLLLQDWIKL